MCIISLNLNAEEITYKNKLDPWLSHGSLSLDFIGYYDDNFKERRSGPTKKMVGSGYYDVTFSDKGILFRDSPEKIEQVGNIRKITLPKDSLGYQRIYTEEKDKSGFVRTITFTNSKKVKSRSAFDREPYYRSDETILNLNEKGDVVSTTVCKSSKWMDNTSRYLRKCETLTGDFCKKLEDKKKSLRSLNKCKNIAESIETLYSENVEELEKQNIFSLSRHQAENFTKVESTKKRNFNFTTPAYDSLVDTLEQCEKIANIFPAKDEAPKSDPSFDSNKTIQAD